MSAEAGGGADASAASEAGVWIRQVDEEGTEFYYNTATEESVWEKPDGFVEPELSEDDQKVRRGRAWECGCSRSHAPWAVASSPSACARAWATRAPELAVLTPAVLLARSCAMPTRW